MIITATKIFIFLSVLDLFRSKIYFNFFLLLFWLVCNIWLIIMIYLCSHFIFVSFDLIQQHNTFRGTNKPLENSTASIFKSFFLKFSSDFTDVFQIWSRMELRVRFAKNPTHLLFYCVFPRVSRCLVIFTLRDWMDIKRDQKNLYPKNSSFFSQCGSIQLRLTFGWLVTMAKMAQWGYNSKLRNAVANKARFRFHFLYFYD